MHHRHVRTTTSHQRRRRRWVAGSVLAAGGLLGTFLALSTGSFAAGGSGTQIVTSPLGASPSAGSASLSKVGFKNPSEAGSSTAPPEPVGTPTAHHFSGMRTVGALFGSATATKHTCTASVIDSPGGNVILTAAHCIRGTAAGAVFVPGYDDGSEPYGAWKVTGSHGAPGWLSGVSTQRDFAFLTTAAKTIDGKTTNIQSVTGGLQLGNSVASGQDVTVPAYASGADDQPLTCTTSVYMDDGFPAFNCNPYPAGTSGGPWLLDTGHGNVVVGIIGGLHAGGCYTYTSYSSAFSVATWNTYVRASMADPTATFPAPGSDDCSS
jgi:V8-like Glu-specific endopeptidase